MMEKLMNSTGFFYTGVKTARVIFRVAAWIMGVAAAVVWFLPESAFLDGAEIISLGPVELTLVSGGALDTMWIRGKVSVLLAMAVILQVILCRVLKVLQEILEPMRRGQPFDNQVPANLKKMAWLALVGGLFLEIFDMVTAALVWGNRNTMEYFNPEVVQSVRMNYELNLWFVAVFCLLMVLSHVFAYGQQLQQLSDETL